jgi:hypothetical protein
LPRQETTPSKPPARRLRIFSTDPMQSTQMETVDLNQATVDVRWETDLKLGPVGEYLEVVDFDQAEDCRYPPVDLNHPALLATDGFAPSEGNPQFHQQMVYAVAMKTIHHFEKALGRRVLWSPHRFSKSNPDRDLFVPRLQIHPHALREANAYYSPDRKALLFGYFLAGDKPDGIHLPGGLVFTCLSHDIIVHETTHALLDGMHRRFSEASNPDVLAFHEAFADIVALFQHFTYPEVLRSQVARTRGDLAEQSLLGELAKEFGTAIGKRGALRDAIGEYVEEECASGKTTAGVTKTAKRVWKPKKPEPEDYERYREPHARGSILVAAVFDAFLKIYRSRIGDHVRLATSGSGILPAGELHPTLVNRLSQEAAKSADHVLTMCIRALDYCPPVDVTFGDYLRALVTADADMMPTDTRHYRLAFLEAFRARGIYPRDVKTLSDESLRWNTAQDLLPTGEKPAGFLPERDAMRQLMHRWNLTTDRKQIFQQQSQVAEGLHEWFRNLRGTLGDPCWTAQVTGLALFEDAPGSILRDRFGSPRFEVHAVRPTRRISPDGEAKLDAVIVVTQRRSGFIDERMQAEADDGQMPDHNDRKDFVFRGGCTLIVDLETGKPRYFIHKSVCSGDRLQRQREFIRQGLGSSLAQLYQGEGRRGEEKEPFALLHRAD